MSDVDYVSLPTVAESRVARLFFRMAVGCAVLPMTLGVGVTILYYFTLDEWLPIAGLYLLVIGLGCFVGGLSFAVIHAVSTRKGARVLGIRWKKRPVFLALVLLFANFPVAFACAYFGVGIAQSCYVDVINESGGTIDDCVFAQKKVTTASGPILPGRHFQAAFHDTFESDGSVTVEITQAGKKESPIFWGRWIRIHVRPGTVCDVEKVR